MFRQFAKRDAGLHGDDLIFSNVLGNRGQSGEIEEQGGAITGSATGSAITPSAERRSLLDALVSSASENPRFFLVGFTQHVAQLGISFHRQLNPAQPPVG